MTISTFSWLFSAEKLKAKFYPRDFTVNRQSIMWKNHVRSEKVPLDLWVSEDIK